MFQSIINQVVPIVVTALGAVLTIVIKSIGDEAQDLIAKKKEALAVKVGVDKYNANLAVTENGIFD